MALRLLGTTRLGVAVALGAIAGTGGLAPPLDDGWGAVSPGAAAGTTASTSAESNDISVGAVPAASLSAGRAVALAPAASWFSTVLPATVSGAFPD